MAAAATAPPNLTRTSPVGSGPMALSELVDVSFEESESPVSRAWSSPVVEEAESSSEDLVASAVFVAGEPLMEPEALDMTDLEAAETRSE